MKSYPFLRFLLLAIAVFYLSGCSGISNVRDNMGSSGAVRVSVTGDPLPQVADNVGSVDTGRLKVYVMDDENPYRRNVVQAVDMDYNETTVAEGKRIQAKQRQIQLQRQKQQQKQQQKQRQAQVARRAAQTAQRPVSKSRVAKVTEVAVPHWSKPKFKANMQKGKNRVRQQSRKKQHKQVKHQPQRSRSYYQSAKKKVRVSKRKTTKKAKKRKTYKKRYKKKRYQKKRRTQSKKMYAKKRKQRKQRSTSKKKWEWDSQGRIVRASR